MMDLLTLVIVYKPGLWRRPVDDWRLRASWRTPRRSRNKRLDSRPVLYTVHREIGKGLFRLMPVPPAMADMMFRSFG